MCFSPWGCRVGHDRTTEQQEVLKLRSECMRSKSPQSCPTLCRPMDCSLPGSSGPGLLQARILEWIALPSLQGMAGTFRPSGWTHLLCLLHWQAGSLPLVPLGKLKLRSMNSKLKNPHRNWSLALNLLNEWIKWDYMFLGYVHTRNKCKSSLKIWSRDWNYLYKFYKQWLAFN